MKYKYTLTTDLVITLPFYLPYFEGKDKNDKVWMIINGNTITIKKGYSWDGCTGVPDFKSTIDASCVHDGWYQFAPGERILGDFIFYYVMYKNNCPVGLMYFDGVRLFGGLFY